MSKSDRMQLPADLVAFLKLGSQLQYDPSACDAGKTTLAKLQDLELLLFPYDTQGTPLKALDPNPPAKGCYLVPAVSLIATSEDYRPDGLVLWLPEEKRYGTWDDSHLELRVFGEEVTWTRIVQNPARFLNIAVIWEADEEFPSTFLVPWPRYGFHEPAIYEPIKA